MGVHYGKVSLLKDEFNLLDLTKWEIHSPAFGTITASSSLLSISNTTGSSTDYLGIHSIDQFPVGTSISVRSRGVAGRHHSLIGFGASPYFPFPHAGTSPGCTWYSRADALTSTISWRSENGVTGFYDSATENLTSFQIFKMIRVSSSEVQFYRNNVLEYAATGLVLANNYSVYFTNDGHTKPNTSEIDWVSVA